jgi:hypothetical protein
MEEENPFTKQPDFRKVILFNGPPRCGKSTGAEAIRSFVSINARYMHPSVFDFAEPLKKAAHALFDVFHRWDYYDCKEGQHLKSLASGDFLGLSPREAHIALSEDFLKPKFGPEVMGFLMRKRIIRANTCKCVIIPNSGFVDELRPIVDLVGQRNILVIEVSAAGRTFEGDSRSYIGDAIKERWPHTSLVRLPNIIGKQEDKEFFRLLCCGAAKKFLKIREEDD